MEKNLPKVYANPINKPLNNNKEYFYSSNNETRKLKVNIPEKLMKYLHLKIMYIKVKFESL